MTVTPARDALVYMAYGRSEMMRNETRFALLSAMRVRNHTNHDFDIIIYTDDPDGFQDLPVVIRETSTETFRQWTGPTKYQHRIKTCVLLDALERATGSILAVDADTWFGREPSALWDRIDSSSAVMHLRESLASHSADSATAEMGAHLAGRAFDLEGGRTFTFPDDVMIWNAGVIGLSRGKAELIRDGLNILDQILAESSDWTTIEQVVMSAVIGQLTISPSSREIYHYWHASVRDPARASMSAILASTAGLPVEEQAERLHPKRPRPHGYALVRLWARRTYRRIGGKPTTVRSSAT